MLVSSVEGSEFPNLETLDSDISSKEASTI